MISKYKLIYIAVVKEGSWIKHRKPVNSLFHYIHCFGIKRHFGGSGKEEVIYEIGRDQ